jgi:ABC-type multidrug transport system fused ATPase/permease subunit
MKLLTPMQWRLYGYLRKYLFPYALLLGVAMGLLSAASAGIPLIMKLVVDLVANLKVAHQLDAHSALKLREYSLMLAGLFLLRAIANFSDDYLSAYISQKLTMDIRADLNESLQRQSLSFFNRTNHQRRRLGGVEPEQRRVFNLRRRHVADRVAGDGFLARLAARDPRLHRLSDRGAADRQSFQESSPRNQESAETIGRFAIAAA